MEPISEIPKENDGDDSYSEVKSETNPKTQELQEEIAKGENKAVFWLRVIVLLVLLTSTIGVAVAVYFYMTDAETDEFETQFNSDAAKVLEEVGKSLDNTLGATDAFVVNMIAYARYSGSEWPLVTMPDFSIQATKLLRLSKAVHMSIYHVVEPDKQAAWQEYANKTHGWIKESVAVQEKDEDWHGPIVYDYNTSYEIFGFAGPLQEPAAGKKNYLPSWQTAPIIPNAGAGVPYNWDAGQTAQILAPIAHAMETQTVSMTQDFGNIVTDPDDPMQVMIAEAGWAWAKSYLPPDEDVHEPTNAIIYPMINTMETVRVDLEKQHPVVGVLSFAIFWRDIFKDILPQKSNGVYVVLEHTCGKGQAFTYQLDGPQTTFLGVGDLHDPKYDYIGYSATLAELTDTSNSDRESAYTGLPLADFCPKTLKVYPSQDMEDGYKTSNPVIFTVIAALIFLFTSVVFVTYDLLVARRQKIVNDRALASGAIVSSLFPEQVRKQLYEEKDEKPDKLSNMKDFMSGEGGIVKSSKPIADLFEETTIFFADLAGFTFWSSKRTPSEVFELLETLYSAFDKIALKRGVFKVETIGDCYVAVTGIPQPQEDHAVIMVKFARDCMTKLSQLVNDLVATLGADTADLEMRVGLHSGSTTAGVLRGAKSRFQLFGDTVNTASRMESNGVRGRMHVSQTTADALIAKGKSHWLVAREDKIEVKGKGEMQTYFVTVNLDKSVRTAMSSLVYDSNDCSDLENEEMENPVVDPTP
jgi:class 3 adenylate cyclase